MKAAFTGTRNGMAIQQAGPFSLFMAVEQFAEFHQGCCVGADDDATAIVADLKPLPIIYGHPSNIESLTSPDAIKNSRSVFGPKPPLVRNRFMVDLTEILIACPAGPEEQRSGTWMTIRYARRRKRPIVIFWPDGSMTKEPKE